MPLPDMVTIRFNPGGIEGRAPSGVTIAQAALRLGAPLASDCGGAGTCGKCRVRVSPLTRAETDQPNGSSPPGGLCLACQTELAQDSLVEIQQPLPVGEISWRAETFRAVAHPRPSLRRQAIKAADILPLGPEAAERDIETRLRQAPGLQRVTLDSEALRQAAAGLPSGAEALSLTITNEDEVIWLEAMPAGPLAGLAVDLGTTTVTVSLCDLRQGHLLAQAATLNPQAVHGADIISRINYYSRDPAKNGPALQRLAVQAVNRLAQLLCRAGQVAPWQIMEIILVGNPTMHHLFLGLDPSGLARDPFQPQQTQAMAVKARQLGLAVNPGAYLQALPLVAGHVGADTIGALLGVGVEQTSKGVLLVDMGTNGELVLQKGRRKACCSCATGPAFEGGCIRQGTRAVPGALCRARLSKDGRGVQYQVLGQSQWFGGGLPGASGVRGICGTGLVELVAVLLRAGVITPSGAFATGQPHADLRRGAGGQWEFVVAPARDTSLDGDLVLTQHDIRQFQLAKGALRAGYRILMDHVGVDELDRVDMAGIFGSRLDLDLAGAVGILPPVAKEKVYGVGDAAAHGAVLALLDVQNRDLATRLAREMEHVELNAADNFQEVFVSEMGFVL